MNECLILIGSYGLMIFTDFVPNVKTRYINGYYMIVVVAFTICINMGFLLVANVKQIIRKIQLRFIRWQARRQIKKL